MLDSTLGTHRQFVPEWLERAAQNYPDRVALEFAAETWTFRDLDREVNALARRLTSAEVERDVRVAVLATNRPEFVFAVHALARLGAILVPLNTRLSVAEMDWQMRDVRARVLLVTDDLLPQALQLTATHDDVRCLRLSRAGSTVSIEGELAPAVPEGSEVVWTLPEGHPQNAALALDAIQAIMYTSGTTGMPKGALLTFGMQWWNATASALNLGILPDDCWLVCLPLYHVSGLTALMKSVIYGMRIVLQERFEPEAVNRAIHERGVTMISVVAASLRRMLESLPDGDGFAASLRCVLLGGGPAPLPLLEDCAARNVPVVQTYGLTESCSQAVTLAPHDAIRKLGSAGRPLLPVHLRVEQGGTAVGPNIAGEICLRGPTITPGYADQPEATAAAFHDGWFATGDIGYLDEEGYLYVLDRRTDLIVSGGENVYPAEIEAVLIAHPNVAEAGVCGIADERWGQVPVGFVTLRSGSAVPERELIAFASTRLARYKAPRHVVIVETLPRNGAGKLLRRELPWLLQQPTQQSSTSE